MFCPVWLLQRFLPKAGLLDRQWPVCISELRRVSWRSCFAMGWWQMPMNHTWSCLKIGGTFGTSYGLPSFPNLSRARKWRSVLNFETNPHGSDTCNLIFEGLTSIYHLYWPDLFPELSSWGWFFGHCLFHQLLSIISNIVKHHQLSSALISSHQLSSTTIQHHLN